MSLPELPFVSIIIPTYNRATQLTDCLQSVCGQRYPKDCYEIIVVDDGSSKPLNTVVGAFAEKANVKLIRQVNGGPSAARNTGALHAAGELLAFTDDDCCPQPDWLSNLVSGHLRFPNALVGGFTVNALTSNPYSSTAQFILDMVYEHFNKTHDNAYFFASNNMAIPAALYHETGGFDVAFRIASEDREYCDRWRQSGRQIIFVCDAVVEHSHALGLASYYKLYFRYGRGAYMYHRYRSVRKSGTMLAESSFHWQLLRQVWRLRAGAGVMPLLSTFSLLGVWQAANLHGFLWEAAQQAIRPPAITPTAEAA